MIDFLFLLRKRFEVKRVLIAFRSVLFHGSPGFLGFCAVAFGAFGAHALKEKFGVYEMDLWKTASTYLMVHSIAAFVSLRESRQAMAGKQTSQAAADWFARASVLFCLGATIFSFSLFLLALTGVRGLGAITPLGGVCLLLAWISLGIGCIKSSSRG
jgi:uncharacterized membrane protein YgdD (TMEM256/DUF423 family)